MTDQKDENQGNKVISGEISKNDKTENALQNSKKWIHLQETAKERALQFMQDPDLDHYAEKYILNSLSENTMRAYASDVKIFRFWCEGRGFNPLPATPNVVANFLAAQARSVSPPLKATTILRRVAAIAYVHRMANLSVLPTDALLVRQTLQGIVREKLMAPHQKEPTTAELIQLMAAQVDRSTLRGARDYALLLLGFAGAFRRSELVRLKIEDLKIHDQGMDVFIRHSKTDQIGQGFLKPIIRGKKCCPVEAIQEWLARSGIREGFLFRRISKKGEVWASHEDPKKPDLSDKMVALIVKKYTALIGLDSACYAGHSLRRGFNTSALTAGASIEKVMAISGQKDPKTVLRYYKDIKRYESNAGEGLL